MSMDNELLELVDSTSAMEGGLSSSFGKVPVTVQVMLGSARMPLSQLLALKIGSVVKLDEALGTPVAIIVNGCKIAMGELFILDGADEKLGVKITELVTAHAAS